MIRRPPRSTQSRSSAASDVYKRQLDASRDYDPSPRLERIQAALLALNFADDAINPPELGLLEKGVARVKNGQAVVFPLSEKTRGHQTHTWPDLWKTYLSELLVRSKR